jgi:outer membrane autotransporter protein
MSGTGVLTKSGTGTVTLSGANTYTGGTTVNAGTLAGTTTSLSGNIVNNATVTFDQGTNGTYAGVMSGTGSLTKSNNGTLTLSGANTYSGGTTINAGTLRAGAANVFGTGAMTVSSGAMLDLGGFSQSLASMTIGAGSTLGGTGTINSAVTLGNGGILAPGNSIGTITVNGSLAFSAGSIYRVEVDAAGNTDRTNVTGAPGTVTIGGGTVDVRAGAGTYQASTQYTILNATGGVTGTFNTVTSDLAFLTPSLSYNANNVFLGLTRNNVSLAAVAATPNQRAVASVLDASVAGATGSMATVLNTLTGLSSGQAQVAYDSIGGAGLVAVHRAGSAFAGGFGEQLGRRLTRVAGNDAAGRMAAFDSPIQLAANDWHSDARPIYAQAAGAPASADSWARKDARGFWMRAYSAGQDTNSDGNAAGNKLRGGGLSVGADTEVRDGLVLGIAGTYGTSRVSFSANPDSGRSKGTGLGVYGSYVTGAWTFKGVAGLAWNDNHAERNALGATATSDFDSGSQSLYAEATYAIRQAGFVLQPLAALSYVRTKSDAFAESGAGALNLQVSEQTTRSTRSLLGAKTIHEVGRVRLEPRVLWAHEFGDVNAPMNASLAGAPAAGSFQVSGVQLKRDSLVLGLGVSGEIRKSVSLFADAQIEGNSRQSGLAAFAGLRAFW